LFSLNAPSLSNAKRSIAVSSFIWSLLLLVTWV
jgi:hypothetical protein